MGLITQLDDPEFEVYTLSPGQRKKLGIIRAIISEPDILFMDEVFVGLDIESLIIAQRIIKEYLPHTHKWVINHKAYDNNYNGFYDYLIKIKQDAQQIILIPLREYDEVNLQVSGNVLDEGYSDIF